MKKILDAKVMTGYDIARDWHLFRFELEVGDDAQAATDKHFIAFKRGDDAKGMAEILRKLADRLDAA